MGSGLPIISPIDLLLYADDLEALGIGAEGRQGIPMSYLLLSVLGYPFKWAKTRGGYRVEWLGMETEYSSYRLGMSKKRATWLSTWLNDKVAAGKIWAKEMQQGLGWLGFAPGKGRAAHHSHDAESFDALASGQARHWRPATTSCDYLLSELLYGCQG